MSSVSGTSLHRLVPVRGAQVASPGRQHMTTATALLNIHDAITIGRIVHAAQHSERAQWLTEHNDLLDGVVRSIGDEQGNFLRDDEDVRDGFLRISATFEHFIPMRDVMRMVDSGHMVFEVRNG